MRCPMIDDNYDENGKLTPRGLAEWADQEGGPISLLQRNGITTFIEAGCNEGIVLAVEEAISAFRAELERIGAVL